VFVDSVSNDGGNSLHSLHGEVTVTDVDYRKKSFVEHISLSLLGSTAQVRPWSPPQNPAEFLGGLSTVFFLTR
jgi:hypothetical protein